MHEVWSPNCGSGETQQTLLRVKAEANGRKCGLEPLQITLAYEHLERELKSMEYHSGNLQGLTFLYQIALIGEQL